jgi:hypothetical protein
VGRVGDELSVRVRRLHMRLALKRGLLAASCLAGCGQAVASSTDASSAHDATSANSRDALVDMTTDDSATPRDAGTTDTGALPDVAACGTPFDATMALPDGGVCSVGSYSHFG